MEALRRTSEFLKNSLSLVELNRWLARKLPGISGSQSSQPPGSWHDEET